MRLFGEGQYNLLSLKEISVTDSFLGLDRDTRNCQNTETYNDCKTRLFVENLRSECGCLPLSLKVSDQVNLNHVILFLSQTGATAEMMLFVQLHKEGSKVALKSF